MIESPKKAFSRASFEGISHVHCGLSKKFQKKKVIQPAVQCSVWEASDQKIIIIFKKAPKVCIFIIGPLQFIKCKYILLQQQKVHFSKSTILILIFGVPKFYYIFNKLWSYATKLVSSSIFGIFNFWNMGRFVII
jgi:hypothetical protein